MKIKRFVYIKMQNKILPKKICVFFKYSFWGCYLICYHHSRIFWRVITRCEKSRWINQRILHPSLPTEVGLRISFLKFYSNAKQDDMFVCLSNAFQQSNYQNCALWISNASCTLRERERKREKDRDGEREAGERVFKRERHRYIYIDR